MLSVRRLSRTARPQCLARVGVAGALEGPRSRRPVVRLRRSGASGGPRLRPPARPVADGAGRDAARGRVAGGVRQDAGGAAGRGALHGRRRRAEEARQQARHRRRERLDTAVAGDAQVAGLHVVEGLHGRCGGDPAARQQGLLADPREGVPLHRLSHEGGVRVRGEVVLRGHRLQRPPAPHEAQVRAGRGAGRVLPRRRPAPRAAHLLPRAVQRRAVHGDGVPRARRRLLAALPLRHAQHRRLQDHQVHVAVTAAVPSRRPAGTVGWRVRAGTGRDGPGSEKSCRKEGVVSLPLVSLCI